MFVYLMLTRRAHLGLGLAAPIAIELSLLWNFVGYRSWTLRHRNASPWPNRLTRFHLVTLPAAIVNYVLLIVLARMLGISDIVANLIGIAAGALINYSANSLWTWNQVSKLETPQAETPQEVSD
jgi:putative flippase GtrA